MKKNKLKLLFGVCFYLICGISKADVEIRKLPLAMKFFSENTKYSVSDQLKVLLQSLASKNKMALYLKPPQLPVDAVITDAGLEKAILISVNRRVNPEYTNRAFKHDAGHIFQLKLRGQQVSMFLYHFSPDEVQSTFVYLKEELQASRRPYSLFLNAAEAGELARSSPSEVAFPANDSPPSHQYVLGEEFAGCGKGLVEGLNNVASAPWNAGWAFGSSAYALYDDPGKWWQRSLQEFKEWKNVILRFQDFVSQKVSKFTSKSPAEQSKIWCSYLGTPGVLGTASKFAKGAGFVSTESKVAGAEPAKTTGAMTADGAPSKLAKTEVGTPEKTSATRLLNKLPEYKVEMSEGKPWRVRFESASPKFAEALRERAKAFNKEFIEKYRKEHPQEFDAEFRKWKELEQELEWRRQTSPEMVRYRMADGDRNPTSVSHATNDVYLQGFISRAGVFPDGAWLGNGPINIPIGYGALGQALGREFLRTLNIAVPQ